MGGELRKEVEREGSGEGKEGRRGGGGQETFGSRARRAHLSCNGKREKEGGCYSPAGLSLSFSLALWVFGSGSSSDWNCSGILSVEQILCLLYTQWIPLTLSPSL